MDCFQCFSEYFGAIRSAASTTALLRVSVLYVCCHCMTTESPALPQEPFLPCTLCPLCELPLTVFIFIISRASFSLFLLLFLLTEQYSSWNPAKCLCFWCISLPLFFVLLSSCSMCYLTNNAHTHTITHMLLSGLFSSQMLAIISV